MIDTVAIAGLGLMGGSLGLALKTLGCVRSVRGFARREQSRALAIKVGAVDIAYSSLKDAVLDAGLVVLCTPVLTIPALVKELRPFLKPGCIVTDVGSTKAMLAGSLNTILEGTGAVYIGSHPMAGSEKAGLEAAKPDLYNGALVLVTPTAENSDADTLVLSEFWKSVGANVIVMSPHTHDALVARTSHLPHLVAALLVATVDRDQQNILPYCGPGFRDSTRIAAGSEDVWHDIVKSNAAAIRQEIDVFLEQIEALIVMLDAGDFGAVRALLASSRVKRAKLSDQGTERQAGKILFPL